MRNGLITYTNGDQEYFYNGLLHKEDGPAVIYSKYIKYYNMDQLHRLDGPAVECTDGNGKEYWIYGKRHRLDGPAIDYNFYRSWWIDGKPIPVNSQEEFERYLKLLAFI